MAAKSDFPPETSEIFSMSVQLGNCNHVSDHFKCNVLITVRVFFYICLQKKQTRVRATYTTTKPIAFVVTKSSSKDSAALSANTQCFKSRPERKTVTVDNQHCQWTVTKTLPDPSHL